MTNKNRPSSELTADADHDLAAAVGALIRDCWSRPAHLPGARSIASWMKEGWAGNRILDDDRKELT